MFNLYYNLLGDQILHFLEFFYYFLSNFESRWSDGPENFTVFYCFLMFIQKTDFKKSFKNNKKIPKNVKFGLQAHFNMENMFSTWNRQFEFWKRKFEREVKTCFTSQLTIVTLYIYIGGGIHLQQKNLTHFCHFLILWFSKSKQSIQTVQHDLYIKMCLQIKFYIFLNLFTIY